MQNLDRVSPYVLAGLGSEIDTNVATAAGAFAAVVRTAEHLRLPRRFKVHVQVAPGLLTVRSCGVCVATTCVTGPMLLPPYQLSTPSSLSTFASSILIDRFPPIGFPPVSSFLRALAMLGPTSPTDSSSTVPSSTQAIS